MSTEILISLIGIIVLLIMSFMKIWIGVAMSIVGFLGLGILSDWSMAFNVVGREPFTQMSSYNLTSLPMFILMGIVVSNSGIAEDLYKAVSKWIGQIRGGLAVATTVACGIFAAITAGNLAATLAMSKIAFPEMKKYNYDDGLAVGSIAAGGTLGFLIPPSIAFILYGVLTEISIGKLFAAGIIPGALEVISYSLVIYLLCLINPKLAATAPKIALRDKLVSLKSVLPMLLLFLFVIGGIYGGIFTPTEAGALGSFGAIIICLAYRKLSLKIFRNSIKESVSLTASILFVLVGTYIFMRFIAISQLPVTIGRIVAELGIPNYAFLGLIIVFYLACGCFLSTLTTMLLTVPILLPIIVDMGYSPVWFGVLMVRVIEIGMITPPIGMNVFVAAKATNLPVTTVFRGVFPFVVADLINVALLVAIPQLSLFLPNMM